MKTSFLRATSVVVAALAAVMIANAGCGSSDVPGPTPIPANSNAPPPPPAGPRPAAVASASNLPPLPAPNFVEADFTESDSSRDPFHDFAKLFVPVAASANIPQYPVILDKFGIDQLKLVAIVQAGDGIRAMFVDPNGKGWVVTRGMHVGRGEMVRLGTGVTSTYPLYWKVDRIKPDSVVLVREDTLHPEVAPTFREIPLHTDGEKT
ncbi:MAG: pilus assembly protein PilP [Polyangiales bacterium]